MEYECCSNERLSGFAGWAVIAFSIFAGKVTVGLLRWRYNRLKKPLHTYCNAVTHLGRSVHLKPMPPFRRIEIASCYNKSPFLALRSIYEP